MTAIEATQGVAPTIADYTAAAAPTVVTAYEAMTTDLSAAHLTAQLTGYENMVADLRTREAAPITTFDAQFGDDVFTTN